MRLAEAAALVGGKVVGNGAVEVTGVAGLREAGPKDLSFVSRASYAPLVASSRAAAACSSFAPSFTNSSRTCWRCSGETWPAGSFIISSICCIRSTPASKSPCASASANSAAGESDSSSGRSGRIIRFNASTAADAAASISRFAAISSRPCWWRLIIRFRRPRQAAGWCRTFRRKLSH